MKYVVATNTDDTLTPSLLEVPHIKAYLGRQLIWDDIERQPSSQRRRYAYKLVTAAIRTQRLDKPTRELIHPIIPDVITAIRDLGLGFVVAAGATVDESQRTYKALGIDPLVDGYYSFGSRSRENPDSFRAVGSEMAQDDFEPVAYLTDKPIDAGKAIEVWGKSLLCVSPEDTILAAELGNVIGSVYDFNWPELAEETPKLGGRSIPELIRFLCG
ncbi:MAG: hypothetical protein ABIJ92_00940 [Candidatus Aenigmatarchaeota archaeon]